MLPIFLKNQQEKYGFKVTFIKYFIIQIPIDLGEKSRGLITHPLPVGMSIPKLFRSTGSFKVTAKLLQGEQSGFIFL